MSKTPVSDREKPRDRVMALPGELRRELLYLAHLDPEKQKSTLLHNVAVSGERIQALIDSAKREGAIEIRNLYGSPKCEALHHPKKYQHTALEDCPVEKEINALTEQSKESE